VYLAIWAKLSGGIQAVEAGTVMCAYYVVTPESEFDPDLYGPARVQVALVQLQQVYAATLPRAGRLSSQMTQYYPATESI
jgi:hypothetical protein